jgi:hypothetical protein
VALSLPEGSKKGYKAAGTKQKITPTLETQSIPQLQKTVVKPAQ